MVFRPMISDEFMVFVLSNLSWAYRYILVECHHLEDTDSVKGAHFLYIDRIFGQPVLIDSVWGRALWLSFHLSGYIRLTPCGHLVDASGHHVYT